MIVVQSDTHDDPFTLESRSGHGDHAECAAPNCTGPSDEFTVTVGCDFEGTAADWGEIGFCSLTCLNEFDSLGTLYTAPHEPRSIILEWDGTQLIRMTRDGIIDSGLAATESHTPEVIQQLFTDNASTETPVELTIKNKHVVIEQDTVADGTNLQDHISTALSNTMYETTDLIIKIGDYSFFITEYGN